MNEIKMKAKKNKKWIESLEFENIPVEEWRTNEERMKNGEEQRKTLTDSLTETSWKCYGSTSAWICFMEKKFFTQNSWNA